MSTSFFGSSLFTRKSRSLNRHRELDKLPPAADGFPTATDAGGGPVGGRVNGRLPKVLQVRYAHSHQTQTTFLPDLDSPAAAATDSCDRVVESFLPFGESETLIPRKASVLNSAATNTPCVHAVAHERPRVNLTPTPGSHRAVLEPPRRNTDPSRHSIGVWSTAKHSLPGRPLSVDGRRPTLASDPGPLLYCGPRDEAQPGHWTSRSGGDGDTSRSGGDGDTLHPVMAVPPCEPAYASEHEWRDTILEEGSDGSESPLAPLDALEGFCDEDATSEEDRRLASIALPPPARGNTARRPSSLLPRTSPQSAPRQSQVMRPLASRIRKLSGASRSSRSSVASVGSTKGNRATQVESQPPPPSVPIHLGPLPPLPESSCERSGAPLTRHSSLNGGGRRWSGELDTSTSALGLSLSATGTWAPDDQTVAGVSYIMPPEERSRITTETSDVEAQSRCSSPSLTSSSQSDHSLDTLLVPASPGGATQLTSPMPASPFLCPTTPVGLHPPPRRGSAPGPTRGDAQ